MSDLLRTAIAVNKALAPGAVANAAAIVMGQLARIEPAIYADDVRDRDGLLHAGIRFNTVILSGRSSHLLALAEAAPAEGLASVVFTERGQALSNRFDDYRALVGGGSAAELGLCAVGVAGGEEAVRTLTKRFGVYRG
ncbi:DUF2000 family protein [Streptomyces litchfieldiae]|uniref:DUF2000 family protein n=1 Tax=Streptomyces litchfieldiae TaxID=3075543 RepID=A0ABU2MQR3_9ACTN|nr:DUF2000 family protein [Streptomyces sp. DSM 44938]MDT0343970.1 DUF2000 family protein [Streptomyces sp. DSM 44938]